MIPGLLIDSTPAYIRCAFPRPCQVLSNAVLNGGAVISDGLLNLRVARDAVDCEHPAQTLAGYCDQQGWSAATVGMMTAATMNSARVYSAEIEGEQLAVLVTSGLANARRAGDRAECRQLGVTVRNVGTINTVIWCTATLSGAAMAEVLMVASEAKAALLHELKVLSPVSGMPATGTGTDVTAVVSALSETSGPEKSRSETSSATVHYAGKHTLLGEQVARLVMAATSDSVRYETAEGKGQINQPAVIATKSEALNVVVESPSCG